jgi:hypothetical protein
MDFESALDYCITKDYRDGPGANLMTVGKLRLLVNYYDNGDQHSFRAHFNKEHGPYHVNGVKSKDGLWREYPNGRLINFHHFPHFRANEGKVTKKCSKVVIRLK